VAIGFIRSPGKAWAARSRASGRSGPRSHSPRAGRVLIRVRIHAASPAAERVPVRLCCPLATWLFEASDGEPSLGPESPARFEGDLPSRSASQVPITEGAMKMLEPATLIGLGAVAIWLYVRFPRLRPRSLFRAGVHLFLSIG